MAMRPPEPFTRSDQSILRDIRARLHPKDRAVFDRAVRYGLPTRVWRAVMLGWVCFMAGAIVALAGYWGSAVL